MYVDISDDEVRFLAYLGLIGICLSRESQHDSTVLGLIKCLCDLILDINSFPCP